MLSFNCPGEKSWEISRNGQIKKSDHVQIMPHTLRRGVLHMPTDSVKRGYVSLTDCFNRTQHLWFAAEELPKVRAALNILKESAPDMEEFETVDMVEGGEVDDSETESGPVPERKSFGKEQKSPPVSVNFKKSVPEAEKLRKNGALLETIGNTIYSYSVALAWIALLASVVLGIYWWIESEELFIFGISVLSGAGAFLVIYGTAWWNRLMFNCFASFLVGQSCIVQSATVTARTNLYMADMLEEQNEKQNN